MTIDLNSTNDNARYIERLLDEAMVISPHRGYLGASEIGETCQRRLQYGFTDTPKDDGAEFSARLLRIFQRGHDGEARMAEWLRAAGFVIETERDGAQIGFSDCDGRFSGHVDGIIAGGPDGFDYPAIWENKVLGSKGFAQLVRHGLAKSHPKYAAQIAVYQAYLGLTNPAVFTALNADTMEIHARLVRFDAELAQTCIDRAVSVLLATDHGETLPRVTDNPEFFGCAMCPWRVRCWK